MKKLLLKSMLLLCALIVGSMNGWGQAPVNTVLWSEDFSGYANNVDPSGEVTNIHTGTTVYGGVTITYSKADATTTTQTYTSGGPNSNANLLISKGNGSFSVSGISTGDATELTVAYATSGSGSISISSSTTGVTISGSTITTNGASTLQLTFTNTNTSNNIRIDDIVVKVKTAGTGGGVAAPTFSVAEGAVTAGTTVILSQADSKTIRYTTNGVDPTKTTGTVYSSPITITTPVTIKAIAVDGDDVSAVASATYSISVAKPTFDVAAGEVVMGTPLTITATTGHTIIYTTDGTDPSYSGSNGDIYDSPIAINSEMTVKAIAVDPYNNESDITSASYTVSYPGANNIIPNYSFFGKADSFSGNAYDVVSGTQNGITVTYTKNTGSCYANSTAMRFYKDNALKVEAPTDKVITKVILSATPYSTTPNDITSSPSGYTASTWTWSGNTTSVTLSRPSDASSYITISKITVVLAAKVTIGTHQWATYVSNQVMDFTGSEVKAYVITGASGSAITKAPVTKAAANTPLLLNAPAETYTIPAAESGTDYSTSNKLVAGDGTAIAYDANSGYNYVLGVEGGNAMFLQIVNGTPATIPAGKAYLALDAAPARTLSLFDDEETTGVNELKVQKADNQYFNLAGQRVAQPTKGLYIVNGKKVIIK